MFSPQTQQQQTQEEEYEEDQPTLLGFCSFCVELVGGTSKKQNWKGLGIAFLVITIICLFIAGAILLTSTQQTVIRNEPLPIKGNDIENIKLPKPWNGTWISEKDFSFMDANNSIWIYNCDTRQQELVFEYDIVQQGPIDNGIISPSTRYILISIRKEKIRPYYTEYQYDIYEKKKMIGSITFGNKQKISVSAVVYSHSDNLFAFIHNFDIYIYNMTSKINYQITFDGNRDTIHNGLVEWIYEYEIFNQNILLFWSPNDRYLAFIKINLTNLAKNHYLKYDFSSKTDDKYSIPYPKYNESLPLLAVYIFDIKTRKTISVPQHENSYVYIYHIVWYCDVCFAVVYGNRKRNSSVIQLYEIRNEEIISKSKYFEETRKGSLLSRFLKPYFSSFGKYAYIIRFDQLNIGKSKAYPYVVRIYFNQTYPQIDAKSPKDIHADEIIHVDQRGQVYFTGSRHNDSLERQLYRWNTTDIECISCNQSCGYANAKFSLGNGSYYILECFGPVIPYATLYDRTGKLALINDNQPFREWTDNRLMPYIDYFSVPLDKKNTGIVGNGMIILPPNYNPNRTIASYPIIVTINDRLDDQRVNKKYIFALPEFIHVIDDNIGIVIFDSHGSTGQDENYFKNNNQNWFERQYEDYTKLAQHLKWNETKFNGTLNETRFGLRARGPAAVIALKLLEENNEYVCAFLESPVNDLSHYHAVFSERIKGLKTDVKSVRNGKQNFENKSLAILHGTANEVVHFKHSATLVKSLTNANIQFNFKVYPDVDHYFDQDPKIYKDFLNSQRQFFQGCLGGRVNKERKIVIPEEEHN